MLVEKRTRPLVISARLAAGSSFSFSRLPVATGDITDVADALLLAEKAENLRALAYTLLSPESAIIYL